MDNRNEERPRGETTKISQTEGMVLSTKDNASYHREKKEVLKYDEERSGHGTSGRSAHGFFGAEVDESSVVFNGDATGGKNQNGTRIHMISGGSVKNNSIVWNGDLDPKSFLDVFCKDR